MRRTIPALAAAVLAIAACSTSEPVQSDTPGLVPTSASYWNCDLGKYLTCFLCS